jgi:hypothetical protein
MTLRTRGTWWWVIRKSLYPVSTPPNVVVEPHSIAVPSSGQASGGGGSYSFTNVDNGDGTTTYTDNVYGQRILGSSSGGGTKCGTHICYAPVRHPSSGLRTPQDGTLACVQQWLIANAVGAGLTAHIFNTLKAANFILDAVPAADVAMWGIDAVSVVVAVATAWYVCTHQPQ